MITIGRKKLGQQAPTIPIVQAGDTQYLVSDKKRNARKAVPVLRIIGNLLILTGVLLLLGIGGWYGYTQYNTQQEELSILTRFPLVTPTQPVAAAATALPTATVQLQIKNLNSDKDIASQLIGVGNRKMDTSPPVRLYIPSVRIDTKVVPVGWNMIPKPGGSTKAEWQVADFAVGHHQGSANPGEPGNTVLSGHVDYKGQVFKDLHLVNKGDEIVVYTGQGQYLYVVQDMKTVQEEGASDEQKKANAHFMDRTPDPTLTLITCFPYGIDDKRLIVIAKPYQPTSNTQSEFIIR